MKLRFAFGTVTYGRRIPNLAWMLDDIADAGYEGVEICQAPDTFGVSSHAEMERMAAERGLKVLGYIGGTLESRMKFCGPNFKGYLVIDDWDDDACREAMAAGYRLALHPHVLHEISRLEDALPLLKAHSGLLLLPDTGHLGINGEDMSQLVTNLDYHSRLVALHAKDWEPQFGRHSHRYARGFVDLGQGSLADEIGAMLHKLAHDKSRQEVWVVAEVDSSRQSDRASAFQSARWLRKQGYELHAERGDPHLRRPQQQCELLADCPWRPEQEVGFTQRVLEAASRDSRRFYQEVAEAFSEMLPCHVTEVRVFTPLLHSLELAGLYGPEEWAPSLDISVAHGANNLCHQAVLEQRTILFDLKKPDIQGQFQRPDRIDTYRLVQMVALPVVNSWNSHHVRFLINLFPKNDLFSAAIPHLERVAQIVGRAADLVLDERCLLAAGQVQQMRQTFQSSQECFEFLCKRIQQTLNCVGVGIFRVVESRERLEWVASTGTEWNSKISPDGKYYAKYGEAHTSRVWARNAVWYKRYDVTDISQRATSWETVDKEDLRDHCMMAPIARHGKSSRVLGVVRCRNRQRTEIQGPVMFTDDDAAALDALLQAALPQLELLLEQESHLHSLNRLVHELHVPNIAIRHCVDRMKRALTKQGHKPEDFFPQNFLGDVWSYTDLIGRYLENAAMLGGKFQSLSPVFKKTSLLADVIAPSVNHVTALLRQHGLSPFSIRYGQFIGIPLLWIDQNQFQQVFFNLLANAIKYGGGPGRFWVNIHAVVASGREMHIFFEDFGPGIPEEFRERIFESGWRARSARDNNVSGQGLGLRIVREIVEAHDGSVSLVHYSEPTRFRITLPFTLASGPPSRHNQL
jgi:signal transduction histidine kinase/sugar phosphate isomerase/epimerase